MNDKYTERMLECKNMLHLKYHCSSVWCVLSDQQWTLRSASASTRGSTSTLQWCSVVSMLQQIKSEWWSEAAELIRQQRTKASSEVCNKLWDMNKTLWQEPT